MDYEIQNGVMLDFADITKAYDNMDLDILDRYISEMNPLEEILLEWQDELQDLKVLNMDVSGVCIKRSNGNPSGIRIISRTI